MMMMMMVHEKRRSKMQANHRRKGNGSSPPPPPLAILYLPLISLNPHHIVLCFASLSLSFCSCHFFVPPFFLSLNFSLIHLFHVEWFGIHTSIPLLCFKIGSSSASLSIISFVPLFSALFSLSSSPFVVSGGDDQFIRFSLSLLGTIHIFCARKRNTCVLMHSNACDIH